MERCSHGRPIVACLLPQPQNPLALWDKPVKVCDIGLEAALDLMAMLAITEVLLDRVKVIPLNMN